MFVELLTGAHERIDVLVSAAVFLHEAYPRLNEFLQERAADGNSLYRADGEVLVHAHVWGVNAYGAQHTRRLRVRYVPEGRSAPYLG